jgi:ribulose 1,5-bisphosphate synthetase/thiazole synthase
VPNTDRAALDDHLELECSRFFFSIQVSGQSDCQKAIKYVTTVNIIAMTYTAKRVAIIGAGVSGVTSAKHLKAAGVQVVVYERSSQCGGNW